MSTETQTPENTADGMAALGALQEGGSVATEAAAPAEPKIDSLGRSYATGRRKDASARVWVKRGTGQIMVNGKKVDEYFARPVLQMLLNQPFETAGRTGEFDVIATVKGGGLSGLSGTQTTNAIFGGRSAGNALSKITTYLAAIFMGLALLISLIASPGSRSGSSVIEDAQQDGSLAPSTESLSLPTVPLQEDIDKD